MSNVKTGNGGKTGPKDKARNNTTGASKKGKKVQDASNIGKLKSFKYYDDEGTEHTGSLDLLKQQVAEGSTIDNLQDKYDEVRGQLSEQKQAFGNIMVGVAMAIQKGWSMKKPESREKCAKQLNDTLNKFWKDNFPERKKPAYFSQTKSNCSAAIKMGLVIKDCTGKTGVPTAGSLNQSLNEARRQAKAETPQSVQEALQALKDTVATGNKAKKDGNIAETSWSTVEQELMDKLKSLTDETRSHVEQLEKAMAEHSADNKSKEAKAAEAAAEVEGEQTQQPARRRRAA